MALVWRSPGLVLSPEVSRAATLLLKCVHAILQTIDIELTLEHNCRMIRVKALKLNQRVVPPVHKSLPMRNHDHWQREPLSKWGGGESNRMVMSISCQRRFGQRKLFVHMSLVCLPSSDTEGCKKHECDILEQDKGTCVGDTIKIIGIQESLPFLACW